MQYIEIHSHLYNYSVDFINQIHFDDDTLEKRVFVIDRNVYSIYKNLFMGINEDRIFLMDAVEHRKNMDTVMEIIHFFQQAGVKKNWKVVCFGGGITQDVTTMASNLFLRNVDWYFYPTTLLSMSDSCIGGKCGINLGEYKNQLGVFFPPKKIFIYTGFINTLSRGDYLNGWGEILKFSLTNGADFYNDIKNENSLIPCENIGKYIQKGLLVKKSVIEEDEFDTDLRRILNYGHTFGHALEAYTDNDIPHGQGVLWGMDVVNYLAYREGLICKEYYLDIKALICKRFLTDEVIVDNPDRLFTIIRTDKKVKDNTMNFAMLDGESHLNIHPMEISDDLKQMFLDYLGETHEYYCH